jgi:TPR repeat protein
MCYLNGTDILKKDEAEAKRYFKAAAKKGHLGAAAKLKAIETEVP